MTDPGPAPENPAPENPAPENPAPAADAPPTGVSIVDEVLAGLDGVERRPVDERLPAFERAHEGLRRALDDEPAGVPADPGDRAGS